MSSRTVSTQLPRLAEQAAAPPEWVFTTLAHKMDAEWLREAYQRVCKDSAAGIDPVTAAVYAQDLDANLTALHQRLKSGQYYAPPVRRIWLEKSAGGQRPIGIPTFEDQIVPRAVAMLLTAIYEQDFYDFAYGFRPGRSAHQALPEVRAHCMQRDIHWIIDVDVSGCFDHVQHGLLQAIVKERVNDGRIIQLIGKWLHAGIMEDQQVSYPEEGPPQGGVISPVLMNIYLHTVLDTWFEQEVRPRLRGRCFIGRFADDFVSGCQTADDARRIMAVLPKRFARYGLTINPHKSRLVRFQPPRDGHKLPDTSFNFLGFTHYWARSQRGYWIVLRSTERKRQRRASQRFWRWRRPHQHLPLPEQARCLRQKLRGYYQYYALAGNIRALQTVDYQVYRGWRYWLRRRGGKHQLTWEQFNQLMERFPLPKPRILHTI